MNNDSKVEKYRATFVAMLRARLASDEVIEDAKLEELDQIWLSMVPEERIVSDEFSAVIARGEMTEEEFCRDNERPRVAAGQPQNFEQPIFRPMTQTTLTYATIRPDEPRHGLEQSYGQSIRDVSLPPPQSFGPIFPRQFSSAPITMSSYA